MRAAKNARDIRERRNQEVENARLAGHPEFRGPGDVIQGGLDMNEDRDRALKLQGDAIRKRFGPPPGLDPPGSSYFPRGRLPTFEARQMERAPVDRDSLNGRFEIVPDLEEKLDVSGVEYVPELVSEEDGQAQVLEDPEALQSNNPIGGGSEIPRQPKTGFARSVASKLYQPIEYVRRSRTRHNDVTVVNDDPLQPSKAIGGNPEVGKGPTGQIVGQEGKKDTGTQQNSGQPSNRKNDKAKRPVFNRFAKGVGKGLKDNTTLRWCARGFSFAAFIAVFLYLIIAFFKFQVFPVIVADVFNVFAVSWVFTSYRLWSDRATYTKSLAAVAASVLSFAINLFGYWAIQNVSYAQVTSDTVVLTPTLNRTVTNSTLAAFDASYWDGLKALQVIVLTTEVLMVMFLLLQTINNCRERDFRTDLAQQKTVEKISTEERATCMNVCKAMARCQCFSLPSVTQRDQVVYSWWSDTIVFVMNVFAILAAGVILATLGLALASSLEHFPAWTTLQSPHFFLVAALMLLIIPPVGEVYTYTNDLQVIPACRFMTGGLFLVLGLVVSTWAMATDKSRVESSSGTWLMIDSYKTVLDGSGSNQLFGGYTFVGSSADSTKLTSYAIGQHVLELLLVVIGFAVFALATALALLDTSIIMWYPNSTYEVNYKLGNFDPSQVYDAVAVNEFEEPNFTAFRSQQSYQPGYQNWYQSGYQNGYQPSYQQQGLGSPVPRYDQQQLAYFQQQAARQRRSIPVPVRQTNYQPPDERCSACSRRMHRCNCEGNNTLKVEVQY